MGNQPSRPPPAQRLETIEPPDATVDFNVGVNAAPVHSEAERRRSSVESGVHVFRKKSLSGRLKTAATRSMTAMTSSFKEKSLSLRRASVVSSSTLALASTLASSPPVVVQTTGTQGPPGMRRASTFHSSLSSLPKSLGVLTPLDQVREEAITPTPPTPLSRLLLSTDPASAATTTALEAVDILPSVEPAGVQSSDPVKVAALCVVETVDVGVGVGVVETVESTEMLAIAPSAEAESSTFASQEQSNGIVETIEKGPGNDPEYEGAIFDPPTSLKGSLLEAPPSLIESPISTLSDNFVAAGDSAGDPELGENGSSTRDGVQELGIINTMDSPNESNVIAYTQESIIASSVSKDDRLEEVSNEDTVEPQANLGTNEFATNNSIQQHAVANSSTEAVVQEIAPDPTVSQTQPSPHPLAADESDYNIPIQLDFSFDEYQAQQEDEILPLSLEDELRMADMVSSTSEAPLPPSEVSNVSEVSLASESSVAVALDISSSIHHQPTEIAGNIVEQSETLQVEARALQDTIETDESETNRSISTESIEADLIRLNALVQTIATENGLNVGIGRQVVEDDHETAQLPDLVTDSPVDAAEVGNEEHGHYQELGGEDREEHEADGEEQNTQAEAQEEQPQPRRTQQVSMMIMILGPHPQHLQPNAAADPDGNSNTEATPGSAEDESDHQSGDPATTENFQQQPVDDELQAADVQPQPAPTTEQESDAQPPRPRPQGFRMVVIMTAPDGTGRIAEIPLGPGGFTPPGFPGFLPGFPGPGIAGGAAPQPREAGAAGVDEESAPDYDALVRLAEMIGPARPRHAHIDDVVEQLPLIEYKDLNAVSAPQEPLEVGFVDVRDLPSLSIENEADERLKGLLGETKEKCTVCLMPYEEGDSLRILKCQHGFHSDCIDQWLTSHVNSCPLCRQPGVEIRRQPVQQAPPPQPNVHQGPPPAFIQAILRQMLMRGRPQQPPPNSEVQNSATQSPLPQSPAAQHAPTEFPLPETATSSTNEQLTTAPEPEPATPVRQQEQQDPQPQTPQHNRVPNPDILRAALLPLLASILMGIDRPRQQTSSTTSEESTSASTEPTTTTGGIGNINGRPVFGPAPPPPTTLGDILSRLSQASNVSRLQRNPATQLFSGGPSDVREGNDDTTTVESLTDGSAHPLLSAQGIDEEQAGQDDDEEVDNDEDLEAALDALEVILGIGRDSEEESDGEESTLELDGPIFIPAGLLQDEDLNESVQDNVSIDE
ncbi:UNVERIFIED_CONTAM: hypothetical protein HDU68_010593 [Siphonaria sp. JEL0065]|nr:hypothetical protein HDU68_010593 [Siphonaria sp. JEL0065]